MKALPIFITGNASKASEVGRYLNVELAHQKLDLVEIQSLDLEEVVEYKAKEAYQQIGKPVLVEDTALVFTALNGLPGPLVKWFLEALGNDGLCQILAPDQNRSAQALVRFGYCDGGDIIQFEGTIAGTISLSPKGEQGFGWDPIFIPNGYRKTWGEMTDQEKDATSMRSIALSKLQEFLQS